VKQSEKLRERVLAKAKENALELDTVEEETLDRACSLADTIEQIEGVLEVDGLTLPGPGGIIRVHPLVAEKRASIGLMDRLIASIKLDSAKGETASQQARRAAGARWKGRGTPQRASSSGGGS
jgi:hypothetical protein